MYDIYINNIQGSDWSETFYVFDWIYLLGLVYYTNIDLFLFPTKPRKVNKKIPEYPLGNYK